MREGGREGETERGQGGERGRQKLWCRGKFIVNSIWWPRVIGPGQATLYKNCILSGPQCVGDCRKTNVQPMAVQLVAIHFDSDIKRYVFGEFKSRLRAVKNQIAVFYFVGEAEYEETERAV